MQKLSRKGTIHQQIIPLAAWNLQLQQNLHFLDNHLSRVPITRSHQGTMGMRDGVLSIVFARDMDTSGYKMSDLGDFQFLWEDPGLNMDIVFKHRTGSPFSALTSYDLALGALAKKPILTE